MDKNAEMMQLNLNRPCGGLFLLSSQAHAEVNHYAHSHKLYSEVLIDAGAFP